MDKHRVESFNLDHTKVKAPYIRLADEKTIGNSDSPSIIRKFDIRFSQPNNGKYMSTAVSHSLEHLIAENIRKYHDRIIDFGPMGCRTGFYLTVWGSPTVNVSVHKVKELLKLTIINDVMTAREVPGCSAKECGNYLDHDLEGAKVWASYFMNHEDELLTVFEVE